ncbi:unnamed protein product [Allacma fusca]|uniref:TIR domain-containing protein n=1 Tax=Allacma fusca TaxID=39272 RepID=A0A8J2KPY4_9HEXA|nr:unnamed protein product [Allacma fusca]
MEFPPKSRLKLLIFLLVVSTPPLGPLSLVVSANLDESCAPIQILAPPSAPPHPSANQYPALSAGSAAALQSANVPGAVPLDTPSTWGETVLCQIRTLHSDLDLDNLTASVPTTIDWSTVSKLILRCNDVLFFESSLSPEQLSPFENLHELVIEKCKLKFLPPGTFQGLRHLRKLSLNTWNSDWASRSLELASNLLEDVVQLRHLNLGYNHMWNLPDGLLCQVSNLQSLNLTHNLLSELADLGLPPVKSSHYLKTTGGASSCLAELRSFDISHNTLRSLGRGRLERMKRLQDLHLDHNWLEELHDEALIGLSQLRTLNLSSNRLVALPPKFFSNSKFLRDLDLHNNSLTSLSSEALLPLEHLQVLDVSSNSLTATDGEPFKGLVRLVILNLSKNQIQTLTPSTFKELYTLQVLDLSMNQIGTIDRDTFMSISNLHSLNLARNRLRVISAHMFDGLYVLHKLILDYNQITTMDVDSLKNCTSLQDLGLVGNQLTTVPSALRGLQLLRTLDLGENRISILFNHSFTGLGQLYGLRLVDNQIQVLPRGLCEPMTRLQVFNMAQNRINKISSGAFQACPDVRLLRLDSNQLQNLPNSLSGQLPNLLWLNVSQNLLKRIEYSTLPLTLEWLDVSHNQLDGIGGARNSLRSHLRVVDASYNLITTLDQTAIPPTLEVIRVNYNRLQKIHVDTLSKAVNLTRVELVGNQMESIPLAALRFPPFPNSKPLPEFYIGGNPFLCDCEMEWLTRINHLSTLRSHPIVKDLDGVMCRLAYSRTSTHVPMSEMKSRDFLCPYKSHCFTLCHCCDFDACDCAMTCPQNCTCYYGDTWKANVVDCAGSAQTQIPSRLPMDSTEVYLDGNHIPILKSHTLIGRKNLKGLYLNASRIETISNKSFNGLQSLEVLHLEENLLKSLQGFEFDHLAKLEELYLQNNRIRTINNSTFLTLKALEILRLDGNLLVTFTVWQLSLNPYLVEIGLSRNPWDCECAFLQQFHSWVGDNSRKVMDMKDVRCTWNGTRSLGPYIQDYDNGTCGSSWAMIQSGVNLGVIPLVSIILAILLVIGFFTCIALCRENLCFCIFKLWGVKFCSKNPASSGEDEKAYDAYLVYSQKDEELVNDKLAEELETHDNYRLCLHHRDLVNEAGDLKGMMWSALESARSFVIIVSKNFFQEWSSGEGSVLCSVINRALVSGKNPPKSLIVIHTEDMEISSPEFQSILPSKSSKRSKILCWRNEREFWNRLKFYLPEPSSYHSNITTTTTTGSSTEPKFQVAPDEAKLWPYNAFVALPPKYQMPKSPPSNSTDSTIIDQNSDASGSGTSGSYYSHHLVHLPKSPLPASKNYFTHNNKNPPPPGDSYLSVEGEHVYSSLDPPSPQHHQQHQHQAGLYPPFSTGGNTSNLNSPGGTTPNPNNSLKNIHLPNGYTYSPSPRPQPQWHPHPSGSLSAQRKNKGKAENVQTYLV